MSAPVLLQDGSLVAIQVDGKSYAIKCLEDLGYFCVDNLPTTLIPTFAELKGKVDGISVRVPTPNVSLVDLTVELERIENRLAEAYGIAGWRVESADQAADVVRAANAEPGPALVEFMIEQLARPREVVPVPPEMREDELRVRVPLDHVVALGHQLLEAHALLVPAISARSVRRT